MIQLKNHPLADHMNIFEQRVFSMKLAQEDEFDNNTICSIVQNFDPSLPQEAAGQLLEEVGSPLLLHF
jgi:hypothetical protein